MKPDTPKKKGCCGCCALVVLGIIIAVVATSGAILVCGTCVSDTVVLGEPRYFTFAATDLDKMDIQTDRGNVYLNPADATYVTGTADEVGMVIVNSATEESHIQEKNTPKTVGSSGTTTLESRYEQSGKGADDCFRCRASEIYLKSSSSYTGDIRLENVFGGVYVQNPTASLPMGVVEKLWLETLSGDLHVDASVSAQDIRLNAGIATSSKVVVAEGVTVFATNSINTTTTARKIEIDGTLKSPSISLVQDLGAELDTRSGTIQLGQNAVGSNEVSGKLNLRGLSGSKVDIGKVVGGDIEVTLTMGSQFRIELPCNKELWTVEVRTHEENAPVFQYKRSTGTVLELSKNVVPIGSSAEKLNLYTPDIGVSGTEAACGNTAGASVGRKLIVHAQNNKVSSGTNPAVEITWLTDETPGV